MKKHFLILFLLQLWTFSAFAADDPVNPNCTGDASVSWREVILPIQIAKSAFTGTRSSCSSSELLNHAQSRLSPEEFQSFERIYTSFFSEDPAFILYQNSLAHYSGVTEASLHHRTGQYPLDGYLAAQRQLHNDLEQDIDLVESIKAVHRALFSNSQPEAFRTPQTEQFLRRIVADFTTQAKQPDLIVDAISRFSYAFLTARPFEYGNQSLVRLLMNELFNHYGITPPLYFEMNEEIRNDEQLFLDQVQKSLAASTRMQAGACQGFAGVSSLNIAPILGAGFTDHISLRQFADWIHQKHFSLPDRSNSALSLQEVRDRIAPLIRIYHASTHHKKGAKAQIAAEMREISADSREIALAKERRLVHLLSHPTRRTRLFTYQNSKMTQRLLQEGYPEKNLALQSDIVPTDNVAGNGIYFSESGDDSSRYAASGGSLLILDVPANQKIIDITRPKVIGELHKQGLLTKDLFYMEAGLPIKYGITSGKDLGWIAYKKAIAPEEFRLASDEDFDPVELSRLRLRLENPAAQEIIEPLLKGAEDRYLKTLENRTEHGFVVVQKPGYFWTPLGQCMKRENDQSLVRLPQKDCFAALPFKFDYDPMTGECLRVSVPEGFALVKAAGFKCRDLVRPEIRGTATTAALLQTGTPRLDWEQELLQKFHIRKVENFDSYGNLVESYQVAGFNKDHLSFRLDTFSSEAEALDHLMRVPAPINLERYVERVYRNQVYFEKGVLALAARLRAQLPGFKYYFTGPERPDLEAAAEEVKSEWFDQLQEALDSGSRNYLQSLPDQIRLSRTIELLVPSQTYLEPILDELRLRTPGFLIRQVFNHSDRSVRPAIFSGSGDELGTTVVEGYQDGISMRISVRFMDSL